MNEGSDRPAPRDRPMPRWPLLLIAAPAAVAIWSGWVGLGGLCGFGPINLLPDIGAGFHLNTAICLPVGVEAYAGFALAVWLRDSAVPLQARDFARWSAIGALAWGMLGQVAYHVLSSLHVTRAPIWVVVLVSCMPVAVVGLAAALVHLMSRAPEEDTAAKPGAASVPAFVPAFVKPKLPGQREVQDGRYSGAGCGQATAGKIQAALRTRDRQWAQAVERSRGGGVVRHPAAPAAQTMERGRGGASAVPRAARSAAPAPATQDPAGVASPAPAGLNGAGARA